MKEFFIYLKDKLMYLKKLLVLIIISIFGLYNVIYSQDLTPEMIEKINAPDNVGNDFWFTMPPSYHEEGALEYVNIYVLSEYSGWVKLEIPGMAINNQRTIKPYQLFRFQVGPDSVQAFSPQLKEAPAAEQIHYTRAANITSNVPVSVYVVGKYDRSGDGFLALPVGAIGTEYMVASYRGYEMIEEGESGADTIHYPSCFSVVSPYDGTEVTIIMANNKYARTSGGHKSGDTFKITMNKGDVYVVSSIGDSSDISGTIIRSNKPVSVLGSHYKAKIPLSSSQQNFCVEMLPPTCAWGKKHIIPPVPNRIAPPIIRIYAKETTTTNLAGVVQPGFKEILLARSEGKAIPQYLESDKPVMVILYNTGKYDTLAAEENQKPFMMLIPPIEQYQNKYLFSLPKNGTDDEYDNNYLVNNFIHSGTGNIPDNLLIGTVSNGIMNKQKLKDYFGDNQGISVENSNYASDYFQLPQSGIFLIESPEKTCSFLQGYNSIDNTYGYPVSSMFTNLAIGDTLAPVADWTCDAQGNINGIIKDMPEDPAKRTNLFSVHFVESLSTNISCKVDPIKVPGVDTIIRVSCEAINLDKDAWAALYVSDKNGNDTIIYLNYFTTRYAFKPQVLNFGVVKVGETAKNSFELLNTSLKEITVKNLRIVENKDLFSVEFDGSPFTMNKESGKNFNILFKSDKKGLFNSTLLADVENANIQVKLYISANADVPLVSITDIDFGTIRTDETLQKQTTIGNPSKVPLYIFGFEPPSNTVFSVTLPEATLERPIVIQPSAVLRLDVVFTPDTNALFIDSIKVMTDANEYNSKITLRGAGSPSSGVQEYSDFLLNVYPNPAKNEIFISPCLDNPQTKGTLDDLAMAEVKISNMLGEDLSSLITISKTKNILVLNVSKLANGVYMLNLKINDKNISNAFTILK